MSESRPRPFEVVTFDFWSTLVDGTITPERTAERLARLHRSLVGAGHACTVEELQAAFQRALEHINRAAKETLRDVGPPGRWAVLARELGIPEGLIAYEVVEGAYQDLTLDPLPDMMPHIHDALIGLRDAGYRLAVICNTGMAGGRVLREVLRRHGLARFFETTTWSDELTWAKPHPTIFHHTLDALGGIPPARALHVGDMEDLDVQGARRAGLSCALYAPTATGPLQTDADLVVTDWRTFPAQLEALRR